jgi:chromosome segregation protein
MSSGVMPMPVSWMVKKQEEVANTQASKMVSLVSVENLSRDIEIKIKEARSVMEEAIESRDSAKVISVLNQITNLFSNFLDHNRDKIDNSLIIDAQKDIEDLKASKKELERKLEDIKKKETELNHKYSELKTNIEKEKDSNRDAEKAVFRIMSEEQELRSKIHTLEAEEENLRLLKENFKREITELGMLVGTHVLQFAKLPEGVTFEYESDRKPQEDRRRVIEKIKIRLEEAGAGFSGEDVMKEFKDATERDEFLARELLDLDNSAKSLTDLIQDLDEKLSTEFKTGVEKINTQFKEYFALMFGGGTAELSVIAAPKRKKEDKGDREAQAILSDTYSEGSLQENPEESEGLDSGIDIDVSLPKKKVKGLMMLSGGERALTSIALLFAISQVNPPPFIILDETDAALDEANSKKYGDMIENLAKFSQLIVITHNRETMSRAGILYGVTMGLGGGSKLLSVAFDEAVAVAK